MEKKEAMKILKDFHDKSALFSVRTALDVIIPELKGNEDEGYIDTLIGIMNERMNCSDEGTMVYNTYKKTQDWLKSLKDRYTWKPSEEQIDTLEHFVRSIGESGYASPYDNNTKLLYSLLEQLKKLKA